MQYYKVSINLELHLLAFKSEKNKKDMLKYLKQHVKHDKKFISKFRKKLLEHCTMDAITNITEKEYVEYALNK